MVIGNHIKELRKSKGIKLIDMAAETGIQIATLSRIENGKMTGTLQSHMKIAEVLGVDVTQLYTGTSRETSSQSAEKITPKTVTDVYVHSDKSAYEILTPNVTSKLLLPALLKIEPNGQTSIEQGAEDAERFLYILEGRVEVTVDQRSYSLQSGNSLYFDAALKHQIFNKQKKMAKIISISTPVKL